MTQAARVTEVARHSRKQKSHHVKLPLNKQGKFEVGNLGRLG